MAEQDDPREELGVFADALATEFEEAHASCRRTPDLLDVLDRAEAAQRGSVPDRWREELAALDSEIGGDVEHDDGDDLQPFAGALRREYEAAAEARSLSPIPAPPRQRRVRWGLVAAGVAAAAAVLLFAAPELSAVFVADGAVEPEPEQAQLSLEREDTEGSAVHRAPAVKPDSDAEAVVEPELPSPEPELPTKAPRSRKPPKKDSVSLEDAAKQAWQRGELAEAERLYRRVVARSGRSRRAELAYGDLFALVRQRRGASAQAELWREYLHKFPRGRFAEDARAGLCRRSGKDNAEKCWDRYLELYPNGAHAGEARRVASPRDK